MATLLLTIYWRQNLCWSLGQKCRKRQHQRQHRRQHRRLHRSPWLSPLHSPCHSPCLCPGCSLRRLSRRLCHRLCRRLCRKLCRSLCHCPWPSPCRTLRCSLCSSPQSSPHHSPTHSQHNPRSLGCSPCRPCHSQRRDLTQALWICFPLLSHKALPSSLFNSPMCSPCCSPTLELFPGQAIVPRNGSNVEAKIIMARRAASSVALARMCGSPTGTIHFLLTSVFLVTGRGAGIALG